MQEIEIAKFLGSEGFDTSTAQSLARAVLEKNGLTRPGKVRISAEKIETAKQILSRLARSCEHRECVNEALLKSGGDQWVPVSEGFCPVCAGSSNRRAWQVMSRAAHALGIERIVIIGGAPDVHSEISLFARYLGGPDMVFVQGDRRIDRKRAKELLDHADLCVTWGNSILPHAVSNAFDQSLRRATKSAVYVRRRGLEALCKEIVRKLEAEYGSCRKPT